MTVSSTGFISISELLKKLAKDSSSTSAEEIAAAVSLIFSNRISPVQFALLLWTLHTTKLDHRADVLAACAASMREAAAKADKVALGSVIDKKRKPEGSYQGGLVDIVGTGGDGHNTYNISTTSSIAASALINVAKHGNNSSTSLSGSADLLQRAPHPPIIASTTAENVCKIYENTNYAFLYAREWHPGMKYGAAIRKEVPVRTLFNLLGPLANPVHNTGLIESRILGVAKKEVGPNFAEALRLSGARKGMVVCGDENLDELSCAGPTHCWHLHEFGGKVEINTFSVAPEDFGLPRHSLDKVAGGKGPEENAKLLMRILGGDMPDEDPVLHFVLLNTAALLAVSGICDSDESNMGPGDDGQVIKEIGPGGLRWKEGLRRARWCLKSGAALKQWEAFVQITNALAPQPVDY